MIFSRSKGKFEKTEKKKLPLSVILIYLLAGVVLVSGVSLARYTNSTAGQSNAQIAIMAAGVTSADLEIHGAPSDSEVQTAEITLTNYVVVGTTKKVCEVSLSCVPEVQNITENIPLQLELYEDEDLTIPAKPAVFKPGVAEEKTYYLKIYWSLEDRDSVYAFEIDALRVIVTATQID